MLLSLFALIIFISLFLSIDLSVKRKIEKKRDKVLYCDSILTKNPFVQAVPSSVNKKSKKKPKEASSVRDISQEGPKVGMLDLWDDEGLFFSSHYSCDVYLTFVLNPF